MSKAKITQEWIDGKITIREAMRKLNILEGKRLVAIIDRKR